MSVETESLGICIVLLSAATSARHRYVCLFRSFVNVPSIRSRDTEIFIFIVVLLFKIAFVCVRGKYEIRVAKFNEAHGSTRETEKRMNFKRGVARTM